MVVAWRRPTAVHVGLAATSGVVGGTRTPVRAYRVDARAAVETGRVVAALVDVVITSCSRVTDGAITPE